MLPRAAVRPYVRSVRIGRSRAAATTAVIVAITTPTATTATVITTVARPVRGAVRIAIAIATRTACRRQPHVNARLIRTAVKPRTVPVLRCNGVISAVRQSIRKQITHRIFYIPSSVFGRYSIIQYMQRLTDLS